MVEEGIAMSEWNQEDEKYMQKMLSLADDETVEWVQKKTREMMTLMVYH